MSTYQRPTSDRVVRAIPGVDAHKLYKVRKARGVTARVSADRARAHVHGLLELGLKPESIARAAGVSRDVIDRLALNDRDRVQHLIDRRIEARVLAVTWRPSPRQAVCLAVGARRRAYALAALGWPVTWQADQLGVHRSNFAKALTNPRISYPTWAGVRDLYETHAMTPGPSIVTRRVAGARGWPPPLAWDDDTIDDPTATPDLGQPDAALGRGRAGAAVVEDIEWLSAAGSTIEQTANRLGVTKSAIQQVCGRNDRRDLLARLERNRITS